MNNKLLGCVGAMLTLLVFSADATAYVGPGLGAGAVAAVLGVLVAIMMLVVGLVWYPIKKLIARFKSSKTEQGQ